MKYPKTEPYRRSRHRAALHAWVVAATAVASIGMPAAAASATQEDNTEQVLNNDQSLALDAQSIASAWIEALQVGDADAALSMMHLPRATEYQQAVQTDLDVMCDMLSEQGVRAQPVAHRHAGHWALSAWALDAPDVSLAPVLEPITLYNPASDGLFERSTDWRVVPHGVTEDIAIKPLLNDDYATLQAWYETLL